MGRYFRLQSITMDTKLNCPIVPRTLPPPKPSRNTETFCLQTPSPLAIVGANTRIENKIDAAARARKNSPFRVQPPPNRTKNPDCAPETPPHPSRDNYRSNYRKNLTPNERRRGDVGIGHLGHARGRVGRVASTLPRDLAAPRPTDGEERDGRLREQLGRV
jgi:hypothetical protein